MSFLPRAKREYAALEFTVGRSAARHLNFLFSYVLSRTHGNYAGLFSSDQGFAQPGNYFSLVLEEQGVNSTGLLPNDRTHVFKLSGSYAFDFGLTAGTFLTVASGTPPAVPSEMPCGAYAGRLAQTVRAYPSWSTIMQKAAARWFYEYEGEGARRPRR